LRVMAWPGHMSLISRNQPGGVVLVTVSHAPIPFRGQPLGRVALRYLTILNSGVSEFGHFCCMGIVWSMGM
jgi:hypothetical protein